MRGFNPSTAQQHAQNFADGGMVHTIKGMLGMRKRTPEELMAADTKRMEGRTAPQKQPAPATAEPAPATAEPAPAPAPAGATGLAGYAGMTALQRREKEAGSYANGGPVRGPGTGTSDEVKGKVADGTYIMPTDSTQAIGEQQLKGLGKSQVPVNLSNGEFKLPPEQVHAVGVQALNQMKDATHTPAPGGTAKGFKPELFFVDGGEVTEQERLARQSAMYVVGAQAAAASRPPQAPAAQMTPAPVNSQPATASPATPLRAPAATGLSYMDNNKAVGDQAKESWGKGQYGQAVGQLAAGSAGMVTTPLIDGAVRGSAAAWEGAKGFGRGLFGIDQGASPAAPMATAAPAVKAPAQAAVTANPTDQRLAAGTQAPAVSAGPTAPAAPAAPAPAADPKQIIPGVYRQGNSYSDSPQGVASTNTGQPNAQNMAAAEALSNRYQQQAPTGFSVGNERVQNMEMPTVAHSGNDWAARKALANAETAASSITANGGRFDMHGKAGSPQRAAYGAMLANDLALQGAAPQMAQTAMREAGANGRATEQQQGETTRSGMRERGEVARSGARNALDGRRLALDERAKGFEFQQAERSQALQDEYAAAQDDPAKAEAVAQKIRALSGKSAPADWGVQVTPQTKNADGSTTEGSIVRFNKATGQTERVDAGQPKNISTDPKALAIKNDPKMSLADKQKNLKALGY